MLSVGLTGGIASGKTTVAEMFESLGAGVVDTDHIARALVEPGEPALDAVVAEFGTSILGPSGALDRAALRAIVFRDAARRAALERILHPRIRERTLAAVAEIDAPYALIVVPLLFETDFKQLVDRIVVVDCPDDLQLERLEQREGIDSQSARAMLAAQTDRASRLAGADDVIDNGGTLEATQAQVETLHEQYVRLASARLPR